MSKTGILLFSMILCLIFSNCGSTNTENTDSNMDNSERSEMTQNMLSAEEQSEGWVLLFDGKSKDGWHSYGKSETGAGWKVADGTIYLDAENKASWNEGDGGDILTNDEYEDFHFKLEWKVAPGGNSGIMFYVNEDTSKYKNTWETGPEMQILDNDAHSDGKITTHRAGDLYDLIASSSEPVYPPGEWNQVEIISKDSMLEFHLNGVKVVETKMWDDAWRAMVAGSKFKDMPGFSQYQKGRISLQDHGDNIWFRNIKIRKL